MLPQWGPDGSLFFVSGGQLLSLHAAMVGLCHRTREALVNQVVQWVLSGDAFGSCKCTEPLPPCADAPDGWWNLWVLPPGDGTVGASSACSALPAHFVYVFNYTFCDALHACRWLHDHHAVTRASLPNGPLAVPMTWFVCLPHAQARRLLPRDAEFAAPMWVFGQKPFHVLRDGRILAVYSDPKEAGKAYVFLASVCRWLVTIFFNAARRTDPGGV